MSQASICSYFHRTWRAQADQILREGFKDLSETYQTDSIWKGTWFCNEPTGAPEGLGDVVLEVMIPEEVAEKYFWSEDQKYREYLIPAEVLKTYPPPRILGA